MPKTINLSTFINPTGKISVIEKKINFKIKRVYFIYDIKGDRGGHKHKKNTQFIICQKGSCDLLNKNKKKKINKVFKLRKPNKGMIMEAKKKWLINMKESFMVGDRDIDKKLAFNANLKFIKVNLKSNLFKIISNKVKY